MANISAEQKALNAIALFEQAGRSVRSVTIKGREMSFTFEDKAAAAASLDNMEFKPANAKKR